MFLQMLGVLMLIFLASCGKYEKPYAAESAGLILETEVQVFARPLLEQVNEVGLNEYNRFLTFPGVLFSSPPPKSYQVKIVVVRLGLELPAETLLEKFEKVRYRPATVYELLALARSGHAPPSGSVAALDKIVIKNHGVYYPYLDGYTTETTEESGNEGLKKLRLKSVYEKFRPSCMFAVVPY
ncbi:MAG: hypothetical protein JNN11_01595 [Candidatus Doudnabacteria bacterium]|nr:hypothetical protein [Candidatus Doudnabacteria bacterium]